MRPQHTLNTCSLTTLAHDKSYHEKPLIRDCCNHEGSCTLFRSYLTVAAGISSSSFVWVSRRQLAVSFLSKGISSTLNFHKSMVLTGLELATTLASKASAVLIELTWLLLKRTKVIFSLSFWSNVLFFFILFFFFFLMQCLFSFSLEGFIKHLGQASSSSLNTTSV